MACQAVTFVRCVRANVTRCRRVRSTCRASSARLHNDAAPSSPPIQRTHSRLKPPCVDESCWLRMRARQGRCIWRRSTPSFAPRNSTGLSPRPLQPAGSGFGRDRHGHHSFEATVLRQHIEMLAGVAGRLGFGRTRAELLDFAGSFGAVDNGLQHDVAGETLTVGVSPQRTAGRGRYSHLCFKLSVVTATAEVKMAGRGARRLDAVARFEQRRTPDDQRPQYRSPRSARCSQTLTDGASRIRRSRPCIGPCCRVSHSAGLGTFTSRTAAPRRPGS
jgi:hypothetical protein